jgi:transcriptional regulator with XRE-family HTH domain
LSDGFPETDVFVEALVRSAANMADKTLGDVVRSGRTAKDIKLRELARRLEVTPSYISDIENDRRVPSEEVLGRIAAVLDLNLVDLVARAGRLGSEAERYLRDTPVATTLFRRISKERLTEDEIGELMDRVEKLRPDRNQPSDDER